MSETDEIMVTVPLSTFIDGVTAAADLESVRALICNGKEHCSDGIKAVLGIPAEKKGQLDVGED